MSSIEKQIELIARIDQLIRMKATGNPAELAHRLEISEASLFRILSVMKRWNAPIAYNERLRSYFYDEAVEFKFGFYFPRWEDDRGV